MKSIVRSEILKKINTLSSAEKAQQSNSIQNQLKQILSEENGSWVAYQNLKDEPAINWTEVSSKIDWAFPRIQENKLEFRKSVQNFKPSALGFAEPQDGAAVELKDIAGFVIPGLAFDKQGYRLGRGKGYYDRSLKDYRGQKIGVCFNNSLYDEVPYEEHDIICDQIITANQIYKVNEAKGEKKWN